MCLASGVPLIDSGTAGYIGQVATILGGQTECFDCQPKETPKTFPVCTIRSTPSTPIHCIVWAKSYLLPRLFGPQEDSDQEDTQVDGDTQSEDQEELVRLNQEAKVLQTIQSLMGTPEYSDRVFNKVFVDDISRLASTPSLWEAKGRPCPKPLDPSLIQEEEEERGKEVEGSSSTSLKEHAPGQLKDQRVWGMRENVQMFQASLSHLSTRFLSLPSGPDRSIPFDKDDDQVLDFVVSASNLRAKAFGIPLQSRFTVKAMAGNIIPAIATTNAIISGIVVQQAVHLLGTSIPKSKEEGELDQEKRLSQAQGEKTIYLAYGGRRNRLCYLEDPSRPNPQCYTCRRTHLTLTLDLTRVTLATLLSQLILKPRSFPSSSGKADDAMSDQDWGLGVNEEDVTVEEGGRLLYDVDFTDNVDRTLASLGMDPTRPGDVTLMIGGGDQEQEGDIALHLQHSPSEDPGIQCIRGHLPTPSLLTREGIKGNEKRDTTEEGKRKVEELDSSGKKRRVTEEEDQKVGESTMMVEDGEDDLIILDDAPSPPTMRIDEKGEQGSVQVMAMVVEEKEKGSHEQGKGMSIGGSGQDLAPQGQENDRADSREISGAEEGKKWTVESLSGTFAVYKPSGITSADVVRFIKKDVLDVRDPVRKGKKRWWKQKKEKKRGVEEEGDGEGLKVGHGGTLDPLAEGVLVVGLGKGTRLMGQFQSCVKEYLGVGKLGAETDTEDSTGEVVGTFDRQVTREDLEGVLGQFTGDIMQLPSIYSALKQDGVPLYEYARQGRTPPRPLEARPVRIDRLELEGFDPAKQEFTLRVQCGGGTYIRSLMRDIGKAVGSGAHMTSLKRVRQGDFTLDQALKLDALTPEVIRNALTNTA